MAACTPAGTLRHKLMPWWFGPPAMAGLGSRTSYAAIERSINKDATFAAAAFVGGILFLTAKFVRAVLGA